MELVLPSIGESGASHHLYEQQVVTVDLFDPGNVPDISELQFSLDELAGLFREQPEEIARVIEAVKTGNIQAAVKHAESIRIPTNEARVRTPIIDPWILVIIVIIILRCPR